MPNKLGSSSYHRGDCGGSHGDYDASAHGMGSRVYLPGATRVLREQLRRIQAEDAAKIRKPTVKEVREMNASLAKQAREVANYKKNGPKPYKPPTDPRHTRLTPKGVAKASKSGWAEWRAKHGK